MRKGYKQTDVGLFPSDWEVVDLNTLIERDRTIRYGIVQPGDFDPNGRYMVRGQDYSFGWSDPYSLFRVSSEVEEKYKNARLVSGDLLLTIVGAGTGHVEEVPDWLDGANITQTTARIPIDKSKANPGYCKYFLKSSFGWVQVLNYMKGAAQPGLNISDIRTFKVVLPPTIAEQTAVATALSDMDQLIAGLEQLIAKKKAIKQGAMQELLRPKEGWVVKRLGEVLKSTQLGGNYTITNEQTENPLIKMGNLQRGYISLSKIEYIISQKVDEKDRLHYGDLLFNTRNTMDLVGKVAIWRNELNQAFFNSNIMRLVFNPDFISTNFFVNNLFNMPFMLQQLKDIATGTTSVAAIYTKDLMNIEFPFPEKKEQIRIAQILSDMDEQITLLEGRLEKYKLLKQGMMQELLTGKTRLV